MRRALVRELDQHQIPSFIDASGNLIAGTSRPQDLKNDFHIALLAHMDHPGFHLGEHLGRNRFRCYWYGGAPFQAITGARVRLFNAADDSQSVSGVIRKMEHVDDLEEGLPFIAEFGASAHNFSDESFGGFDFPGFSIRTQNPDKVVTRAADDLAGCVIALGALIDQEIELRKSKSKPTKRRLLGVFTRAEEVGFVGCIDLLKNKVLPENVWCVSLEASRALPEAEMGLGPVLRIGDKSSLFDGEFSSVLWKIARELSEESKKSKKPFQFQRRIMSGGTCEGTPLTLFGHKVTAIAVPLLNYHNFGQNKPQAEAVSLNDVDLARKLCFELGRRVQAEPRWNDQQKKALVSDFLRLKPMLYSRRPQDAIRGVKP